MGGGACSRHHGLPAHSFGAPPSGGGGTFAGREARRGVPNPRIPESPNPHPSNPQIIADGHNPCARSLLSLLLPPFDPSLDLCSATRAQEDTSRAPAAARARAPTISRSPNPRPRGQIVVQRLHPAIERLPPMPGRIERFDEEAGCRGHAATPPGENLKGSRPLQSRGSA